MSKTFRPYDLEQQLLLPAALQESRSRLAERAQLEHYPSLNIRIPAERVSPENMRRPGTGGTFRHSGTASDRAS
jgi:hypothetical protein